jgi:exosome complex component RRP40
MATASYAATSVGAGDEDDQDMSGAEERCLVLPGDDLTEHITNIVTIHANKGGGSTVRLGAGLEQVGERVLVTKAGRLGYKAPNRFFVLSGGRRYVPCVGDTVIGIVTDRNAEFYRVKLNATTAAILPVLAFDGATKHNKPSLEVGSPVFARVATCSRYFECELSCQGMVYCGSRSVA